MLIGDAEMRCNFTITDGYYTPPAVLSTIDLTRAEPADQRGVPNDEGGRGTQTNSSCATADQTFVFNKLPGGDVYRKAITRDGLVTSTLMSVPIL